MRILQWNVWYKEDPIKIAKAIKQWDVDVVLAQELMEKRDTYTAEMIAEHLGYQFVYQRSETWDRPEKEAQGNAIFSRLPILDWSYHYVQTPKHNPHRADLEGRVYIQAYIGGDRLMTVATTHLSYTHKFEIHDGRQKEAAVLYSLLKQHESNFVFGGDLNATPESQIVKNVSQVLNHAGPSYREKSWTTKPFNYHGFVETELNWRLDYVFTTPDVTVMNSEVLKTDVSDHLPILIEIE
jgi:endonuclease/exonuclease/phosphatase family metal-dependent hydrolase